MIRVIDFEATTGDDGGRVIEAGWCDLMLDPVAQRWVIGESGGYLCGIPDDAPMPADARAVHHIRRSELAGLPRFDSRLLYEDAMRAGAVCLAAQGADFEARHIMGSLPLICTYKAALRVWPDAPAFKNFALLYMLEDRGVSFDQERAWPPHRAEADAYATAVVLREIMATDVDSGFLTWILRTITDREDLRYCAALELDRREEEEND